MNHVTFDALDPYGIAGFWAQALHDLGHVDALRALADGSTGA